MGLRLQHDGEYYRGQHAESTVELFQLEGVYEKGENVDVGAGGDCGLDDC